MRTRVAVIAVLIAILAGGWWFDVPTRLGWRKPAEAQNTLYGNVDIRQVQLGFRVAGRLSEMAFEEGESIKAGTVLAKLDIRSFEDQVRAADAQVKNAEATLSRLIAGPREAEIAQARATVAANDADVANAVQTFERVNKLRETGASSIANYDQALATRNMAQARLLSSREALRLLLEGTRPEDIAAARATLEGMRANLAAAETALADATLKAPSDGVILSRVREPGAIVGPSDIVYVLSLSQPVWVRAYIPEPSLGRIHPGMEVSVTSDTRPNAPYRGRVGFISPVAEFTPKTVQTPELRTDLVYRLRITIENADQGLRQGMPVTVRLEAPPANAAAAK
ncbi:inner membrane protein YibH [Variibacter gotjawalensis]|uniref:Inner membrane protein YibH n=1 Tax=Variibacter gotjawalensis TaxID=1333996 RepID=A0A0S3PUG4_9BRAD|nr:secretion protein HlyD [Variibacter gotjawalensis]NIK49920.1 HlyD family secretion protein [Variibacter gotjawalensis]RZS45919.1 HlyD family secretion protein [Variibacter gotjawalensis]BAT59594.1 inner membrane protein YibH [Variibacter gotjawalensis]